MAFESDIWLVVLDQQPSAEALRAHWNVKDEDTLTLVSAADRLGLGQTRAITPEEPHAPGPAGRVSELLGLIGSEMRSAEPSEVRAFLDANLGRFLLFDG